MARTILLLLLGAALAVGGIGLPAAQAQGLTQVNVQEDSRFWIEGSTSVNRFTCRVGTVTGGGRLPTEQTPHTVDTDTARARAALSVPVGTFDCGREQMTEDLQATLHAKDHPEITFRLDTVEAVEPVDSLRAWYRVNALGHLRIAGTERLIRIAAHGRQMEGDRFQIAGCKPLKMTYFGIEPPTKFMGLVKVQDRIEVHFDLIAAAPNAANGSAASGTIADSGTAHQGLTNPPPCHD